MFKKTAIIMAFILLFNIASARALYVSYFDDDGRIVTIQFNDFKGKLRLQVEHNDLLIYEGESDTGLFQFELNYAKRWGSIDAYIYSYTEEMYYYVELYFDDDESPYQQIFFPRPISDSSLIPGHDSIKLEFTVNSSYFYIYNPKRTRYDMDVAAIFNERGDRVLIPVRFFAESLGYEVEWDGRTGGIIITSPYIRIDMQIGSNYLICDNEIVKMDEPLQIKNGRTYLPLRFVSEAFGFEVDWDYSRLLATIYK
ncbi:MAG: copper amine oxidase N-terminal domain-containing protein [Oscillospiraceae bacterium]|nr:copper amine oxidase N-terminal domain-containing protein [Oscillospiraceae bacterium]